MLHVCANTCVFHFGYSSGYVVALHCDVNLNFSDDQRSGALLHMRIGLSECYILKCLDVSLAIPPHIWLAIFS